MKLVLQLLMITLLLSCGKNSSEPDDGLSSESASIIPFRALAEYEAMDTILLSVPLVDQLKGTAFRDEYSKMMQKILNNSDARISFYSVFNRSNLNRLYDFFPEFLPFSSRIDVRPIYEEFLDFKMDEGDDFGTWMRDASPIPGINTVTGKTVLFDAQYGEKGEVPLADSIPQHFSKSTGLEIVDIPMKFEGGNFMTTSTGICSVSYGIYGQNQGAMSGLERDKILMERMGCKSVIFLEPIPGAIEHSDMIAKFLDDSTVAITEFTSNQIYFDGNISLCPSGMVGGDDCVNADWGRPAGLYDAAELGAWLETETLKRSTAKFNNSIGGEGRILFDKTKEDLTLKSLSQSWRRQFELKGFKVVALPTPAPNVTFFVSTQNGNVWINSELEYVTYANALIFNKKIFVPSYQYSERIIAANSVALDAYRAAGWNVTAIETNKLTIGREGSIHCMSMSVRTQ